MRYIKMLGLAAVAAMALTAFLGASSASATVLCKTTSTPCGKEWHYPKGTVIDASLDPGSTALLTDTSGSVIEDTCTASTVKGTTETTGSSTETVVGTTSVLSFGAAGTPCTNTTTVLNQIGNLEIHWIEGTDNGTLTAKGFEVTVLASGISCIFGASTGIDLGTFTGGSMGTMDVHAIVKKVGGSFLCPSDSVWDAKYTVTEPSGAVYVETE